MKGINHPLYPLTVPPGSWCQSKRFYTRQDKWSVSEKMINPACILDWVAPDASYLAVGGLDRGVPVTLRVQQSPQTLGPARSDQFILQDNRPWTHICHSSSKHNLSRTNPSLITCNYNLVNVCVCESMHVCMTHVNNSWTVCISGSSKCSCINLTIQKRSTTFVVKMHAGFPPVLGFVSDPESIDQLGKFTSLH